MECSGYLKPNDRFKGKPLKPKAFRYFVFFRPVGGFKLNTNWVIRFVSIPAVSNEGVQTQFAMHGDTWAANRRPMSASSRIGEKVGIRGPPESEIRCSTNGVESDSCVPS